MVASSFFEGGGPEDFLSVFFFRFFETGTTLTPFLCELLYKRIILPADGLGKHLVDSSLGSLIIHALEINWMCIKWVETAPE